MSSIFPQENQTSTSPVEESDEKVQVNLDEEVEVANAEGDFNERTAPPPPSKLQPVRWGLLEKGVVSGVDKNKKGFLTAHLKAELIDVEGFEGYTLNYYPNSIVFRGKTTSELHHLMNSIGEPLPKMKLGEMIEKIQSVMANGPVSYVETDWKASYQGTEVDPKTNKPKWVDQIKSADQFPMVDEEDEAGNKTGRKVRSFIAQSKKDNEPIYAQLYIKQILSPAEVQKRKQQMGKS